MKRFCLVLLLTIMLMLPVWAINYTPSWMISVDTNVCDELGFVGSTNLYGLIYWMNEHWTDYELVGYVLWSDLFSYFSTNDGGYVTYDLLYTNINTFLTNNQYVTQSALSNGFETAEGSAITLGGSLVLQDGGVVTDRYSAIPYFETVTAYETLSWPIPTAAPVLTTARTIRASTTALSNSWSGTTFTAPRGGYYMAHVLTEAKTGLLNTSIAESVEGSIYRNGSLNELILRSMIYAPGGDLVAPRFSGVWAGYLAAGNTLDFRQKCALYATATYYRISIMWAGSTNQY